MKSIIDNKKPFCEWQEAAKKELGTFNAEGNSIIAFRMVNGQPDLVIGGDIPSLLYAISIIARRLSKHLDSTDEEVLAVALGICDSFDGDAPSQQEVMSNLLRKEKLN